MTKRKEVVAQATFNSRRFLGKLSNFVSKEERHHYDKMLKAYLKGQQYFNKGSFTVPEMPWRRFPMTHLVKQEYYNRAV